MPCNDRSVSTPLAKTPESSFAHNLIEASRFAEAEPLANDLVKRSPDNSEFLYLRSLIYRGEGRFSPRRHRP